MRHPGAKKCYNNQHSHGAPQPSKPLRHTGPVVGFFSKLPNEILKKPHSHLGPGLGFQ